METSTVALRDILKRRARGITKRGSIVYTREDEIDDVNAYNRLVKLYTKNYQLGLTNRIAVGQAVATEIQKSHPRIAHVRSTITEMGPNGLPVCYNWSITLQSGSSSAFSSLVVDVSHNKFIADFTRIGDKPRARLKFTLPMNETHKKSVGDVLCDVTLSALKNKDEKGIPEACHIMSAMMLCLEIDRYFPMTHLLFGVWEQFSMTERSMRILRLKQQITEIKLKVDILKQKHKKELLELAINKRRVRRQRVLFTDDAEDKFEKEEENKRSALRASQGCVIQRAKYRIFHKEMAIEGLSGPSFVSKKGMSNITGDDKTDEDYWSPSDDDSDDEPTDTTVDLSSKDPVTSSARSRRALSRSQKKEANEESSPQQPKKKVKRIVEQEAESVE